VTGINHFLYCSLLIALSVASYIVNSVSIYLVSLL